MRAEHPAVHVRLVHHHPGQVGEHVAPLAVLGERAHVDHVRVGEDQVRPRTDRPALVARRVAVVDRVAQERRTQLAELAGLVLRERLRRVEVKRAGAGVVSQRVEHRQVEGQRLAAGRPRRDDGVALAAGGQRIGLVRVEPVDAGAGQRLQQRRVQVVRHRNCRRPARAEARLRHHLLAASRLEEPLPGRLLASHGHGLP